jgi:hypothetical protein
MIRRFGGGGSMTSRLAVVIGQLLALRVHS